MTIQRMGLSNSPMALFLLLNFLIVRTYCQDSKGPDEFCSTESFGAKCPGVNEVVLMRSATYGRMQVGRCVTREEMDVLGDDPRYIGCSVDVLEILDRSCSGQQRCEFRVGETSDRNIRPCIRGLVVYLEASYECVAVADEKRSCTIKTSTNPTHIISSSPQQRICGREFHPWIVESPVGQRISVTLIDFNGKVTDDVNRHLCNSYATIVDREGKRNVSICGGKGQRQSKQYMSTGNNLEIYFNSTDFSTNDKHFMLNFEAVGCSDIIPPEDTWLKRKEDAIVIGCYSNRLTWKLSCSEGKWIGVLGNCSINKLRGDTEESAQREAKIVISDQEQVLAIVAISGCTFAVCLVIVCVGTLCLRRFYVRYKTQHDYKSLSLSGNQQEADQRLTLSVPADGSSTMETVERCQSKGMSTYSVFLGNNDPNDDRFTNGSVITH